MTNDGTQDPGPPPVLADPVSGLVTGGRYEPEPLKVRVVEPPMPDISAVREAMADVLGEDSELTLGLARQQSVSEGAAGEIPIQSSGEPDTTPPAGIPAQQSASPAETPAAESAPTPAAAPAPRAQVPAPRMPEPPQTARVITPGTVERTRKLPSPIRRIRRNRPDRRAAAMGRKSSAPSVAVIAALLLVIGVIAIVLISSLIDTIASIFG